MAPFRILCDAVVSVAALTIISAGAIPAASQSHAQEYPTKPVTIISDSAAGSTPDAVLRVIADQLSQMWGQQILAVNHPGATGSIASRIAADSPPDGYTLYMPVLSSFVALPGPAPNVPIRLPRDFTAIGFAAENPMFVVASHSLGINKISDLIAQAKASPGTQLAQQQAASVSAHGPEGPGRARCCSYTAIASRCWPGHWDAASTGVDDQGGSP